jgi:hypothetical protein
LSQATYFPPDVAVNPTSARAKFETSYAPGVHEGNERMTGPEPSVENVIRIPYAPEGAEPRSYVTSYAMLVIGAEMVSAGGLDPGPCAIAIDRGRHAATAARRAMTI